MAHVDNQISTLRAQVDLPGVSKFEVHDGDTSVEPLQYLEDVFTRAVRSARPDLTNRQMALLMTVYLVPLPHTVRGLSAGLLLSKPVVSRALQQLESLGLLDRQKDRNDHRNILIERTSHGAAFLIAFSEIAPVSSAHDRTPKCSSGTPHHSVQKAI